MAEFLRAIPLAAKSPSALAAYAIAAILFIYGGFKLAHLRTVLDAHKKRGRTTPREFKELIELTLNTKLPESISAEQWLRSNRQRGLLSLAFAVVVAVAAIIVIALTMAHSGQPIDQSGPKNVLAVGGKSNAVSATQSIQTFGVTNVGFIQGLINAQGQNPISLTLNNFYGSNSPDPEAVENKKRLLELEDRVRHATNDIQLSRAEVLTLTETLKRLDDRTDQIQKLPDGRTALGGVIILGSSKTLTDLETKALNEWMRSDFKAGLNTSQNAIEVLENVEHVWLWEVVSLTPKTKAVPYYLAALCSGSLGSNRLANDYALKSVRQCADPFFRTGLVLTFHNLAVQALQNGDVSNAFEFSYQAITNHEGFDSSNTNLAPWLVAKIYETGAESATRFGKTNEARTYAQKVQEQLAQTIKPN